MPELDDAFAYVKKETDVRKKILRDYNKRLEDFETEEQYNDYLEEIEEIIFNLVNGVEIDQTNEKIRGYRAENSVLIRANAIKKTEEDRREGEAMDRDRREREQKLLQIRQEDQLLEEERRRKQREEEQNEIEKLEKGDKKKKKKKDKKEKKKKHKESRNRGDTDEDHIAPFRPGPPFGMPMDTGFAAPQPIPEAPVPTAINKEDPDRPIDRVASAKAGGYLEDSSKKRAWEEVFASLFL